MPMSLKASHPDYRTDNETKNRMPQLEHIEAIEKR